MSKLKTYHVMAKLDLQVTTRIQAASLKEAVAIAITLGTTDFVEVPGELIDGDAAITGVYED
mgnify:CR=1 FL=1